MANNNNIVVVIAAQDNSGVVLKQLEDSLGNLKTKANEAGESIVQIGSKAAAIATAAAIAVKAVSTLGTAVTGALDLGTQLENMNKKTGLSVETLSMLRYTAKLTGNDFESAAKGVSRLDKSIAEAASGNKQLAAQFEQLGLNVNDLATAPNGAEVAMRRLGQVLSDTTGPNKQGVAMKLLGRSGNDMLPVLTDLATNWDYFRNRAASAGELLAGPQAAALAESNRKLADLKLQVEGATVAFTKGLLPGLNATLNVISGGKGAMEGLVELGQGIGRAMTFAASAAYGLASGLARIVALQSLAPSYRERFNKYADDFDKKSRDAMYFTVHGKEATSAPADPLTNPSSPKGKPASLINIDGSEKMQSATREKDAAQLRLDEQQAQLRAQLAKTSEDMQLAELEDAHKRNLVSDADFYAQRLTLQKTALDQQRQAAQDKQAEIDKAIGKLEADAKRQGSSVAVEDQAKILDLRAKRLAIDGEIAKINADGAKAEIEAAQTIYELSVKQTEQVDELAAKREAIAGGDVTARLQQSADSYDIKRKELIANYGEGSQEVSNADFAFTNEQGQIRAKGVEETSGLAVAGINAGRSSIADAEARGGITTLDAQRQRIALDAQEAEALQPVLEAYRQLAQTGDLSASEKVLELQTRINELKNPVDEVASHMRDSFDGAFESLFENLDQGLKGFESFTKSVEKLLEQAAYKRFLEPLVQMELGKLIPNSVPGAPGAPAYGDAGIGGVHAVPDTSLGTAVKAAAGIGSALGIPGLSGIDKKGSGGAAITITLVNEGGLPLKIGDTQTSGNVDKDQVLSIVRNSFDEGGIMRALLTGFGL